MLPGSAAAGRLVVVPEKCVESTRAKTTFAFPAQCIFRALQIRAGRQSPLDYSRGSVFRLAPGKGPKEGPKENPKRKPLHFPEARCRASSQYHNGRSRTQFRQSFYKWRQSPGYIGRFITCEGLLPRPRRPRDHHCNFSSTAGIVCLATRRGNASEKPREACVS